MNYSLILTSVLLLGLGQTVETFRVDPAHSSVAFKARHLGIATVNGHFEEYEATIRLDPEDLSTFQAEISIQVGSISTGIDRRDSHLKSDAFFDVENFSEMSFQSREVRALDGSEFELVGDLTIRGTTKEVVLDVEYGGEANVRGTRTVAFEARGRINRFDYGLHWDSLTEIGGLVVGEEIRLRLEVEAKIQ